MYPAISEKDLLGLPFAQADPASEKAIRKAVADAGSARHRAEKLLETAKLAVEIAIEHSGSEAMQLLREVEG